MSEPRTRGARILALGDSYTIGESVNAGDRWPAHLVRGLRARGIAADDAEVIARTGWTTDELNAAIDAASPDNGFDLVTLLIGVNNQYRGRSAENYRSELRSLLARAVSFAGSRPSHVLMLSIPDWGVTPFAAESGRDISRIGREIDAFNRVGRDEADRAGVRFVDITAISRRAPKEDGLIASDGLHPSGAMYEAWSTQILPLALEVLEAGGHV